VRTSTDTFTTLQAALKLGFTQRHVKRLVKKRELRTTGKGNRRRITGASIERYAAKKKWDQRGDLSLCKAEDPGKNKNVAAMIRALPPLSAPRSAARRLGIPEGDLQKLVRTGDVPVITIGRRQFIPRGWLSQVLLAADGQTLAAEGSTR
jgi:excisionase family DNA binding protein